MPSHRSAHARDQQDTQQAAYRRAADVEAFVAAHGVTVCPAGQTSKPPSKPVSAQRRPRKLHAQSWTVRRAIWRKKSQAEHDAWLKGGQPAEPQVYS